MVTQINNPSFRLFQSRIIQLGKFKFFALLFIYLDQLPGDISLLLTNAVWFKDAWNQPFDPVHER